MEVERFWWMTKLYNATRLIAPKRYIRPSTKFIKGLGWKDIVGVEIGVETGYNSNVILLNLPMKKLYLVDPFGVYTQKNADGTKTRCDKHHFYKKARSRVSKFSDKFMFVRTTSEAAITFVPDNLDFVYIDANHDYDSVKQDIELWYPKVRKGGVVSGHDFNGDFVGLCDAVIKFAKKHNKELQGGETDWWFVK